ncbi:MAG TPA: translation initiation factor IF-2 subunit alpha, partial [Candidatus Aenigmarchaeota archaeon]|nr:translation initiation factor IF-2 subunit alpha [Candidatus Aenigmarchaeota archaeon]
VMSVEGNNILLSIKRVRKEEAESKLNEFKRERKAEKLLELAAKMLNKDLDTAYREAGFDLQEEFGSLHKAFEMALKNPELLRTKGIPGAWVDAIVTVAKKSYSEKVYEVKAELTLICYAPDGVEVIKNTLIDAIKGKNIQAKYISAPRYMLTLKGKNYKQIKAELEETAEGIVKAVSRFGGDCSFRIVE